MKLEIRTILAAALVIGILIALITLETPLGLPGTLDVDFAIVLPYIIVMVLGISLTVITKGVFAIIGFPTLGIGLALLLDELHTQGYISVQMLTGLVIGDLYMWCIVLGLLGGAIVSAMSRRR